MCAVTLFNTRPAHQAEGLTHSLQQQGIDVVASPLLHIQACALQSPPYWSDQDVWVFVSRNAVEMFADQLKVAGRSHEVPEGVSLVAVGQATLNVIKQQGWQGCQPLPPSFDSEGMLQLPAFQAPQGLRVGIVRGRGGRELLAQTLKAQQAQVRFYEVYQRQLAPFDAQTWQALKRATKPVILLTSVSQLQALLQWIPRDDLDWCLQQPLIVFSARIAQAARGEGFSGLIVQTETSSDAAVLQALQADF